MFVGAAVFWFEAAENAKRKPGNYSPSLPKT
jgi:hypothetical protein